MARSLDAELHEYKQRGHFMDREFPELLSVLTAKIEAIEKQSASS